MTRDGIYKLAALKKSAGSWYDSAAFLGTILAAGVAGPSIGLGWTIGKLTTPREMDKDNIQKEYRRNRLRNDRVYLQMLNKQLQQEQGEQQPKSVYGLVNAK